MKNFTLQRVMTGERAELIDSLHFYHSREGAGWQSLLVIEKHSVSNNSFRWHLFSHSIYYYGRLSLHLHFGWETQALAMIRKQIELLNQYLCSEHNWDRERTHFASISQLLKGVDSQNENETERRFALKCLIQLKDEMKKLMEN